MKRTIDKINDKPAFIKAVKERLNMNLFNKLREMKKDVATSLFPKKDK